MFRRQEETNNIDPKFFNQVSQYAHFFAAYSVYLSIAFFMTKHYGHIIWSVMLVLVLLGAAIVGWKEFWYDYHYENAVTRGSSLEDFVVYCLGMAAVLAVIRFV